MGRTMKKIIIDELGAEYVQPAHLTEKLSVSRTTVWRLLNKMRAKPKYKNSFLNLTWHLKLVKLADFEKFLQEENNQYLRK